MINQDSRPGIDPEFAEEEESEGFDVERVKELAGFVLRSARRRSALAAVTFVVVAGLGITAAAAMPQLYNAQLKLLAERSHIDDTNPNRRSGTVDRPTQDLAAMIMRRDNLVTLVRDAHLVDRFDVGRSALLKWKDRVMAAISGPPSREDRELGLVYTLERRLSVEILPDDATAVISVDWPNGQVAYDLVTLVQRNFLEARYDTEVSAISDIISVSEEHARDELAQVDAALATYEKTVAERLPLTAEAPKAVAPPGVARAGAPAWTGGSAPARPDPEVVKALELKRARIRALEESQQRTLEALRQQLAQAQLTLTPLHPTVIGLQQQIEAVSEPSPELAQLRDDERALMAQLASTDGAAPRLALPAIAALPRDPLRAREPGLAANGSGSSAASSSSSSGDDMAVPLPNLDRDGQVQLAQSRLGAAIRSYQEALSRVDAARLELQTERVAFKHRYTVVTPAELPKKPKKATAALVGVGSVFGGALLALLLAAAADMAGGRVLETWQVRRRLKLDVLGELDAPS